MNEQDPLKKNRLGLRGMLLVSGGVLVAGSVLLLPNVGPLQGSATTTSLPTVPKAPVPAPTSTSPEAAPQSRQAAAGPAVAAQALLPVYWLGDVEGSDRLFREFRAPRTDATGDPIADAVRLMTSSQPLDPDYRSSWQAASEVSSSISTRNVITLDISSDAFDERLPEDEARLAIQQLVHTATAAAAKAGLIAGGEPSSVVVLVDGTAGHRAFGAVELRGEWTRDTSTLAPVWIIEPQEGVEADASGLTVHGVGPTGGRSVSWRIDRVAGGPTGEGMGGPSLFSDGTADIEPGQGTSGAYSFTATLPPGHYEITVSAPSGTGEAQDSKTIRVR